MKQKNDPLLLAVLAVIYTVIALLVITNYMNNANPGDSGGTMLCLFGTPIIALFAWIISMLMLRFYRSIASDDEDE